MPSSKRPRSALERLEAWADEWPMQQPKIETADYKPKDGVEGLDVKRSCNKVSSAKVAWRQHFV